MADNTIQERYVLVADDDPDDRFLIRKALHDGGCTRTAQFVSDGEDLFYFLRDVQKSPDFKPEISLPALILLDLNMPRMNGREALKALKADPILKVIPVVILTTSKNPEDVVACYEMGASSFFTKPLDYDQLVGLMRIVNSYWFEKAKLPDGK